MTTYRLFDEVSYSTWSVGSLVRMFAVYFVAAHLNLGMTLSALGRHNEAEQVWSVYMIIIIMYMYGGFPQVLKHCATISSERLKDPKAHMSSGDAPNVKYSAE